MASIYESFSIQRVNTERAPHFNKYHAYITASQWRVPYSNRLIYSHVKLYERNMHFILLNVMTGSLFIL